MNTICWHSLKTKGNTPFSGGICFCLLKAPGNAIGMGPPWAELTAGGPWTSRRQAQATGCQKSHPAFLTSRGRVFFSFYSPPHTWQASLGVRGGMASLFWFTLNLRMEPYRTPALRGGSSVKNGPGLGLCLLSVQVCRLANALSADAASVLAGSSFCFLSNSSSFPFQFFGAIRIF